MQPFSQVPGAWGFFMYSTVMPDDATGLVLVAATLMDEFFKTVFEKSPYVVAVRARCLASLAVFSLPAVVRCGLLASLCTWGLSLEAANWQC